MKAFSKLVTIYFLRGIMYILHIFPVKQGRIIFFSHHGTQYSGNPMYISEYLDRNYSKEFEIIWAFKDPKQFLFLHKKGIKIISYFSLRRLYYEATAQVSINNVGSFSWIPLRNNQLHINTWHGGGCYKAVSLGEKKHNAIMKKTFMITSQETSYMVSTSKYFSEYVIPNDFAYFGPILNTGYPRNDILINGDRVEVRKKVCNLLNIDDNYDLILYAPTWRYENEQNMIIPDFNGIKKAYAERFNKDSVILFRAHHWMTSHIRGDEFIDATEYQDMQELLLASDMLVSDYSSCIWDYSLTYRPCLLFTPDLKQYTKERGFDVDIYKWGFPVCETSDVLCDAIRNINLDDVRVAMEKHHEDLGSYEQGNASKKIGTLLYDFCFRKR